MRPRSGERPAIGSQGGNRKLRFLPVDKSAGPLFQRKSTRKPDEPVLSRRASRRTARHREEEGKNVRRKEGKNEEESADLSRPTFLPSGFLPSLAQRGPRGARGPAHPLVRV